MARFGFICLAVMFLYGAAGQEEDDCVCLEQFGTEDLNNPVFFIAAPGDHDRFYVGEQFGHLWVYYKNGTRNPEVFLNVSDRFDLVSTDTRGLLGMTFHPDYENNHKFYIYATDMWAQPVQLNRVSEFTIQEGNPDKADMDSERVIIEIPKLVEQESRAHNGGEMFFHPVDGMMYIFPGDGGVRETSQDPTVLLGKAVRIDVNTGDDDIPYLVPQDNPFVGDEGIRPEIYSLGLRNAWRCTADIGDPETGEGRGTIYCGDVGQQYCEEVNIMVPGGNYGWPVKECVYCCCPPADTPEEPDHCIDDPPVFPGEEIFPVYYYTEWAGLQSITGGHVYRGDAFEGFQGDYIWSDYLIEENSGLNRLREVGGEDNWVNSKIDMCDASTCGELESSHWPYAFSFGQDLDHELYILESNTINPSEYGGIIYKIVTPPDDDATKKAP